MNIKDEIFRLNEKYEENDFNGIYHGINNLKVIAGNLPILFSAPHSVKTVRDGLFKRSDGLTGGIVEYLAYYDNVFGITRLHNMLDDPNYYNLGNSFLYKKIIIDLVSEYDIKYLFDIHGCSNEHNFDISLGTNNGMNADDETIKLVLDKLKVFEKIAVDEKFKASKGDNISRYIHERMGIPCIQIEISEDVRFNKTELLIKSFETLIDEIKEEDNLKGYTYKKIRKCN